jgi:hypothetical protein
MAPPLPKPPGNLHPLSRELLESLAGHAAGAEIVIGGGVALSHYLEYRPTVDLDAWWHGEPRADVVAFLEAAMQAIASRHGFEYRRRSWGETESLELLQGTQKQFSFQISRRTLTLDKPLPSQWEPIRIDIDEAKRKIIARLAMIEASRPLETIQPGEAREQAARVRGWYSSVFAVPTP